MKVSKEDLLEAGWEANDAQLVAILDRAGELESRGVQDRAYLLKLLERDFPKGVGEPLLRKQPLALAEALAPETPLEEENLGAVRRQLRDFLRVPVITGAAVMPDACPSGKGASVPVGGVLAAENALFPAAHSSDICCSMFATFFCSDRETSALMDALVASTRFGPGGRDPADRVPHPVLDEPVWANPFLKGLQEKARMHIADQGDGNHFAFLGRVKWNGDQLRRLRDAGHRSFARELESVPESGAGDGIREMLALVTHHGSRGLGAAVFTRGMTAAVKQSRKRSRGEVLPEPLAWLDVDTPVGESYWEALQYVGRWTKANHEAIHQRFLERIDSAQVAAFGNEHNFVWKRGSAFVHGKGATPAWRDGDGRPLLGLIPLNMACPILVVLGNDNMGYLSFAPHGAGRNMSRRAALREFRLKGGGYDLQRIEQVIKSSTRGIDVRWFTGKSDFSETPKAYKDPGTVRKHIEQFKLAEIVAEIEPLGSVMAGGNRRRGDEEELTPKQLRQIQHRADRRKQRQRLQQGGWDDEE